MSDQKENEFGFEEEGFEASDEFQVENVKVDQPAPEDAPEPPADFEELSAEFIEQDEAGFEAPLDAESGQKSSMSRLLLIVLLLLVVAGGLFYFLAMPDEPEMVSTLPVQTKKQAIAIPEPSKPEPAPAPAPASQDQPPAAEAPAAPSPTAPAQVATPEPVQPAVAVTASADEKPAAAASPVVVEPAPPAAALPQGDYMVNAGAFMLATSLKDAEARIAKLELPVKRVMASKIVPMTRLQYGIFAADQVDAKLAELRKNAPDAFKLSTEGQFVVYAGSYSSLDKARRFADLLYEKGIVLTEVKADVPVPLTQVEVGPFVSRTAAESAAKQLQDVGLEGQVVRIKQAP